MNLRSDSGPQTLPAAKIAVLNCKTNILTGYDGKVLSQQVLLETDADTDISLLKEAIEGFRISSVAGTVEKKAAALGVFNLRYGYAAAEVASWNKP